MNHLAISSLLVLVTAACVAAPEPAPSTHQVKLNGHTFTLPAGFTIELVAGPPLVNRPVTADFDEAGNLYVSDSSGSNEPVNIQLAKKPHRIVRLTDTTGSGQFDSATLFADKMMFPAGTMWLAGSLYVSAPPTIWKLTDADGDGIAEQRSEWFDGKTLTGCANDLHGPYRGQDGWIYWCKGAFAQQSYGDGKSTKAAHIFRSRPDGTGVEPVMTGGMDNPVDIAFTPGGERFFTTTFLQFPAGGRRDGIIHAIYGGVYGKDHEPIYSHPWTSPRTMPVMTHLGPAAPSGLHRYESNVFGDEYRDNLFATQFNLRKVSRHVLIPDGATFRTRDEDFLVSDNFDFHPTDVIEDADGSLLVIDTGGWYKLCCPTAQLVKPDVLGAIYRIRRQGMPQVDDPRGRRIAWNHLDAKALCQLLDDSRPVVRRRAIEQLPALGDSAVASLTSVLETSRSVEARRNAVWALCRISNDTARNVNSLALKNTDDSVRQAAIHAASVWRDGKGWKELTALLTSASLHNRRAAAEALGRLRNTDAIGPLLMAADDERNDVVLNHSLTFALIELNEPKQTAEGLRSANPRVRRMALTALDQMSSRPVKSNLCVAELEATDPALRETAAWIVGRHPEWAGDLVDYYRRRLAAPIVDNDLSDQLARMAGQPPIQTLLAESLHSPNVQAVRAVMRAMGRAGLKHTPDAWIIELTQAMGRAELRSEAVATARALPIGPKVQQSFLDTLMRIGGDDSAPEAVRLSALAAVPVGKLKLEADRLTWLIARLDREQPIAIRSTVAEVLSRANLTPDQLRQLAGALPRTGPMELTRLLGAFATSTDEPAGLALIAALNDPTTRAALRVETVKLAIAKSGPTVAKVAEPLFALLDADQTELRAKLERLAGGLKGGDVRRGQAVFNSAKASCASCHAIGYVGGKVGPDLTHIGKIRTERDLLESIVVPNASFVRGYEPIQITTQAGRVFNGLVRRDAPDEIELALNATDLIHIPRSEIESVTPSRVSVMPSGLDQQLSATELTDLVAFLKACQ